MVAYREDFRKGSAVRIRDRAFLERFMQEWRYHHKLQPAQLAFADIGATVRGVSFYHGGDVLYELEGVPGIWHEACLLGDNAG
jgi:hypothetical protein